MKRLLWILVLVLLTVTAAGAGVCWFWPRGAEPVDVVVVAVALGMDVQAVDSRVAKPLSRSIRLLPTVREVRSMATEGAAALRVRFAAETEIFVARAELLAKVQHTEGLPTDVSTSLNPIRTRELLRYCLTSSRIPLSELSKLHEATFRRRLLTVPGVANVDLRGDALQELTVALDPARLAALRLAPTTVVAKVRAEMLHVALPKGRQAPLVLTGKRSLDLKELGAIGLGVVVNSQPLVLLPGTSAEWRPVELRVFASTPEAANRAVDVVTRAAGAVVGAAYVERLDGGMTPHLNVFVDRKQAAMAGVSAPEIQQTVRLATSGEVIDHMAGGIPGRIRVRIGDSGRSDGLDFRARLALAGISVYAPAARAWIALSQVTRAELSSDRARILRINGRRAAVLWAWGRGRPEAVADRLRAALQSHAGEFPPGLEWEVAAAESGLGARR